MDDPMIIKLWGVRGSTPTSISDKEIKEKFVAYTKELARQGGSRKLFGIKPKTDDIMRFLDGLPFEIAGHYGGNSACIEVDVKGSPLFLFDTGTGVFDAGESIYSRLEELGRDVHICYTHTHLDHMNGFPTFLLAYLSGDKRVKMTFYGNKIKQHLSRILRNQQLGHHFPVPFGKMPFLKGGYVPLDEMFGEFQVGNVKITYAELPHVKNLNVLAYAINANDKKAVIATDIKGSEELYPLLVQLSRDADVLIHDMQYSLEDYYGLDGRMSKAGWGHSNFQQAIRLALAAGVKRLVGIHFDPRYKDADIDRMFVQANEYAHAELKKPENAGKKIIITPGYQGLELRV